MSTLSVGGVELDLSIERDNFESSIANLSEEHSLWTIERMASEGGHTE